MKIGAILKTFQVNCREVIPTMVKIFVRRIFDFKAPYELLRETQDDWTHFIHLHKKSHGGFRLLYKKGNREIFLYKAWKLTPFPFFPDIYVVFRDYLPAKNGYRNVYLNVKTGQTHYLHGYLEDNAPYATTVGEFLYTLPSFFKFFPNLFFRFLKLRGKRVLEEDNVWMVERMAQESPVNSAACAPEVPETYDLFDDLFKDGKFPEPDIRLEERLTIDLESRAKKLREKKEFLKSSRP